jgi:hypothetical protein
VRRLTGITTLALAAGIMVPAAMASTPAPHPQTFGVRLVDVPAAEARDPRALRYIVDYLPTGSVIHRRILVVNNEDHTARFAVYPDAARIVRGLFIGDAGATPSELTKWVTVEHPALSLPARTSVMDMVTIKVPPGATRGEQYGVIWVQQEARARDGGGLAINEISRVGVRVYLAVGRGGAPPTSFAITSITGSRSSAGRPVIVARVDNTGQRAIDLAGSVSLSDGPGGTSAGPFPELKIMTLAPGQSADMMFDPSRGVPDGPWHATVTLSSGLASETASAVIRFGEPTATGLASRGLPWLATLGFGLLIATLAVLMLGYALRQRQHAAS